uniref:Uncharacterized protein n=1 Tax=Solanum lycopersicum TaxID=4081 RepID=A0A3Q7HL25_SOLLC
MYFNVEALKEKLSELQKIQSEANERRSSYEPQVENINTVEEVDSYKEYLMGAMERVQRSKLSQAFTESTPIPLSCDEETVVLDDREYYMHVIEQQEQEVREQKKLEVTNSFNQEIENVVPRIVTDKVDHVVEFALPGPTKMSTRNTQTPTW